MARQSKEVKEILADRDYWQSIAPEGWRVGGFTYRQAVSYHRIVGEKIVGAAHFDHEQVSFLKDLLGISK